MAMNGSLLKDSLKNPKGSFAIWRFGSMELDCGCRCSAFLSSTSQGGCCYSRLPLLRCQRWFQLLHLPLLDRAKRMLKELIVIWLPLLCILLLTMAIPMAINGSLPKDSLKNPNGSANHGKVVGNSPNHSPSGVSAPWSQIVVVAAPLSFPPPSKMAAAAPPSSPPPPKLAVVAPPFFPWSRKEDIDGVNCDLAAITPHSSLDNDDYVKEFAWNKQFSAYALVPEQPFMGSNSWPALLKHDNGDSNGHKRFFTK